MSSMTYLKNELANIIGLSKKAQFSLYKAYVASKFEPHIIEALDQIFCKASTEFLALIIQVDEV